MYSPRWRKILRDLFVNKLRTVLVVLSIAVGVFGVGMVEGTGDRLLGGLNAANEATHPSNATIYIDPFGDELVTSARHVAGVAAAQGRRSLSVRVEIRPGEWKNLTLYAYDDLKAIDINRLEPEQGHWPPATREVVLERASLAFLNATVGQPLQIELPDRRKRSVRVAGTAYQMTAIPPFWSSTATGYLSFSTLEALGFPRFYNELEVVADQANTKADVERVASRIVNKVEQEGTTVYWTNAREPGKHWASDNLKAMGTLLSVLSLLTLLLSALLVVNTISALLLQQTRQIGVMKAIGANTGQIIQLYLGTTLIYSLLALLIAVPLGALGGSGMGGFTGNMLNLKSEARGISFEAMQRQLLAGLIVPLLASLYPVIAGARVSVREALGSYGVGRGGFGQSRIDRLIERVRGLARPVLLSLRNTFRRKGRLTLTLATLTLAGSIFIGVVTVRDSLLLTMEDALKYWNYDIELSFNNTYRIDQIEHAALNVAGVRAAEVWDFESARRVRTDRSESGNLLLVGLPANTQMLDPYLLEGRWLLDGDTNALVINTDVIKTEETLKVGDIATLTIGGRKSQWHIVGLVRGLLSGSMMYANQPYVAQITRNVGRGSRLQVVTDQHQAIAQTQVAKALQAHYEQLGMRVGGFDTTQDLRARMVSQFNVIVVFLLVMAILLAVVGGLGLMGTMSINVIERQREIGVLRAIGAGNLSLAQIVIVEGILIGLISWVIGLILAIPLSMALSRSVGESFLRAPLSYQFSVPGALLWLGLVTLLATIASLLPARSATRVSVREVLAYE